MKYEITVITPFYNVERKLFEKCCESMFRQTIGFQKIEWIVVVHNTDEEYRRSVTELLCGYDNVKIFILNDGKRTPSAPRNYGLERAAAPYIGFLDADDMFTPQCLQKALFHMKKNNAQITWFRREYELESDHNRPVTEIVLWDQTREEIIVDKEYRDEEKMFSGVCGMVTSRIYDKRFVDKNAIRFDEEVPFGEDYLFNLECYGHADKICYLPQMIGYHYFINSASLVQNSGKDARTLIAIAKGYKKIFDAGLGYGFFMNAIISSLCCVLAGFMVGSDSLTMEDRQTIREILAPYLDQITPLRVSKLYSEKAVQERYEFPRAVILEPENFINSNGRDTLIAVDAKSAQALTPYQIILRNILHRNQNTDMGMRYGFTKILTLTGFRSSVPVSNYDIYEPLIKLQTNIGESAIITADPIKSYMFTLGKMSNPKLIPCTDTQLEPLKKLYLDNCRGKRTFLMLESMPQKDRFNDNTYVNTAHGSILSQIFADRELSLHDKNTLFTAPPEVLFPAELTDLTYIRLLFALADRSTDQMIAPNTWEAWCTMRFLENNWQNLCADIASGKPEHFGNVISDQFRRTITHYMSADPERAAELTEIFAQGFETPVVPRIWKNMTRLIAFGGGSFSVYTESLKRHLGGVIHENGCYMELNALIGIETGKSGLYALDPRNAFVEFVPIGPGSNGEAVFAPEVVIGKRYSLLISTYSGLYRYRLDDVVRIEAMKNGTPIFTYDHDASQTVHLSGAFVTEKMIFDGVKALQNDAGLDVSDFTYMLNQNEDGLVVLIETENDGFSTADKDKAASIIEISLEKDERYHSAVAERRIQPVSVEFTEQETQLFYRDVLMFRLNFPTDFIKPVRYIDNPVKERFFRSRIIQQEG
ncbi:MAG: GH3 auxin-responsive promoter family protein [Ruminococcus sp.]|nr:GH3 auxin-responsive promoter family protein [Ruminococcus sp.]